MDDGRRTLAWNLVDDEEPDRDRRAVFEVAFLEADRGSQGRLAQDRLILVSHPRARAEPVRHDRDEASARAKAPERCLQVAHGCIVVGPASEGPREWRIHEDEGWPFGAGEGGTDCGAVMTGDGRAWEHCRETSAPRGIQFVQVQSLVSPTLRHEKSIAGARFEDDVIGLYVCQQNRDRGYVDGCRELLPLDLLLTADGLRGKSTEELARGRDVGERGQTVGVGA